MQNDLDILNLVIVLVCVGGFCVSVCVCVCVCVCRPQSLLAAGYNRYNTLFWFCSLEHRVNSRI